jgi:hypothetical protein
MEGSGVHSWLSVRHPSQSGWVTGGSVAEEVGMTPWTC